jgi:hypothetical protein
MGKYGPGKGVTVGPAKTFRRGTGDDPEILQHTGQVLVFQGGGEYILVRLDDP